MPLLNRCKIHSRNMGYNELSPGFLFQNLSFHSKFQPDSFFTQKVEKREKLSSYATAGLLINHKSYVKKSRKCKEKLSR